MRTLADTLLVNGFVIVGGSPAAVFARGGLACVCMDVGTAREWCAAENRSHGGLTMHDNNDGTAPVAPCKWRVQVRLRNGTWKKLGEFLHRADADTATRIAAHAFKHVRVRKEDDDE